MNWVSLFKCYDQNWSSVSWTLRDRLGDIWRSVSWPAGRHDTGSYISSCRVDVAEAWLCQMSDEACEPPGLPLSTASKDGVSLMKLSLEPLTFPLF